MSRTVLITRPQPGADNLARKVSEQGWQAIIEPVLDIVPVARPDIPELDKPELDKFDALAFTSGNGVRFFAQRTHERSLPVFAVGSTTARLAKDYGFHRVESADGNSDSLAQLLCRRLKGGARILHPAGEKVAGNLAETLGQCGMACVRVVLYRTQTRMALTQSLVSALKARTISAAIFYSPATAAAFCDLYRQAGMDNESQAVIALCLSDAVAAQLRVLGWKSCYIAARPTQTDMLRLLDEIS